MMAKGKERLQKIRRELDQPYDMNRDIEEQRVKWNTRAYRWQPIETAPMSNKDGQIFFIGMRQETNGRMNCATCYKNQFGAYEWWGGGITPTHWMPLPNSPKDHSQ